jgi:hypothetical protein
MRRIDQGAALAAAGALPDPVSKELRTRCRTLRVMLHGSGLAATYAFVAAKSAGTDDLSQAYGKVATMLRQRLVERGVLGAGVVGHRAVLAALGELPVAEYARASAEATALMSWLARLADALRAPGEDE